MKGIKLEWIESENQIADIFTKALQRIRFEICVHEFSSEKLLKLNHFVFFLFCLLFVFCIAFELQFSFSLFHAFHHLWFCISYDPVMESGSPAFYFTLCHVCKLFCNSGVSPIMGHLLNLVSKHAHAYTKQASSATLRHISRRRDGAALSHSTEPASVKKAFDRDWLPHPHFLFDLRRCVEGQIYPINQYVSKKS